MATLPGVSMRRVCRVLKFPRAQLRARAVIAARPPVVDEVLADRIHSLIALHPTFGYRRLWALLRFGEGIHINRKAVYRVLRLKGWFVNQRVIRPRPRVQGLKSQEFITPYTPEQNGIVERFFRSLKEECVWQRNFQSFPEARAAITRWIEWYNAQRPHQALGYRSPRQFRALQPKLVA